MTHQQAIKYEKFVCGLSPVAREKEQALLSAQLKNWDKELESAKRPSQRDKAEEMCAMLEERLSFFTETHPYERP